MQQGSNKNFFGRVNNKKLREEIIKSQEQGFATDEFWIMIYTLAHKITRKRRFFVTSDQWKDDGCSYAVLKCTNPITFNKYNISLNTSALSFFTTTIERCFYDCWTKDFYKFFDLKRDLMRYNSCSEDSDPFFDQINQDSEKEENSEVEHIYLEEE